ncbi:serine/threonine-protein kinase [Streptomyces sp. MI02-7b]|uniref:serine/threonine-protein kinase n=1 Tax=Streptomyces sp. MI02-7b TaxID=462941 RepID=UPI0029B548CE|nr:serine/threonine-protein kinase [Streptomyces sp. MI02-7b]MDX3075044.1 serine/threonine-protein kinase [Streptomyces sp. MI02-7b]
MTRVVAERYRLIGELGRGGMGVVWLARDELLGREVAVKEVKAPPGFDERDTARLYARLEQEGRAAARVEHPNVVKVYDVAMADGNPWIVMELIRGLTLADVLDAEGPMAVRRAADIGSKVLAALRVAHAAGVLHRDVKPGNVLIGNDGRVVLTDFGIAMIEGTSALTRTGELVGSPEYLAPERALGRRPGPASDLWSLGVLLYVAVEGGSPFRRDTALSTMRAVVDEPLPPPGRAGPLGPVIAGLLRKDPAARLPAAEAGRQLEALASGRPAGPGPVAAAHPPTEAALTVTAPQPVRDPDRGRTPVRTTPLPPPPRDEPPAATATGRPRRALLALAAGVLALALGAGGMAYALLDDDGGGGAGSGPTATTGGVNGAGVTSPAVTTDGGTSSPAASSPAAGTGSASPTDGHGPGSDTSSGTSHTPVRVNVHVSVHAVRDSYTGACPPPEAEAPAFSAVVTVDRTPATVTYRWRTGSGTGGDPAWRRLDFPAGGDTSRTVEHIEPSYEPDATHEDWMALETGSPEAVESEHVPFTVTCRTASPSPSPSPTGTPASP